MKTPFRTLLRFSVVFALCAALGPSASARSDEANIGPNVASIQVSPRLDIKDVETALIHALSGRKWTIREKNEGEIVAFYQRRNNVCTLTIRYDAAKIDLYAVGQARGGGLPMRWIENLRNDTEIFLSRALLTK